MSAKIYDLAAYRPRRLVAAPRKVARRCCVMCGRPGHDRRTCKNPLPERLAKYGKVTP